MIFHENAKTNSKSHTSPYLLVSKFKHSSGLNYGHVGFLLFSSKCTLINMKCKQKEETNLGGKNTKKTSNYLLMLPLVEIYNMNISLERVGRKEKMIKTRD